MTDDPVYDEPPPGVPRSALWDEDDFETPADLLEGVSFPDETIFTSSSLFSREDESDDADFYTQPRFLTHIDDEAIAAVKVEISRIDANIQTRATIRPPRVTGALSP